MHVPFQYRSDTHKSTRQGGVGESSGFGDPRRPASCSRSHLDSEGSPHPCQTQAMNVHEAVCSFSKQLLRNPWLGRGQGGEGRIQPGGQVWLMRARPPWLPVTSVVADESRCARRLLAKAYFHRKAEIHPLWLRVRTAYNWGRFRHLLPFLPRDPRSS